MARLLRLVSFFFTAFTSTFVFADYTPPLEFKVTTQYGGQYVSDRAAVCSGAMAKVDEIHWTSETLTGVNTCIDNFQQVGADATSAWRFFGASYVRGNGFGTPTYDVGVQIQRCTGSTRKSGAVPNVVCNGTPPPPPCTAGEQISSGVYDGGKNPASPFPNVVCHNGCSATFEGTWPAKQSEQGDGTHYYAVGSYAKDGAACTATAGNQVPSAFTSVPLSVDEQARKAADDAAKAAAATKAAQDEAARQAKNTADKAAAATKAAAAAAAKSAADKAAAAAKTASDKAAADAEAAAAKNADPNATQAEKDAANAKAAASAADAANKNTTSTNADNASAAAAGEAAKEMKGETAEKQKDLCDAKPNLQICKTSAINVGFCANGAIQGFSCDGDAIQCETAKREADNRCQELKTDTTTDLGQRLIQGQTTAADLGGNDTFTTPTTINIGSLDTSSFLPKGCLSDLSFTIVGQVVVLPLASLCEGMEVAGKIVLGFAYMIAAKIIFS